MKREIHDAVAARVIELHDLKFALEKTLESRGYTKRDGVFDKVMYAVDCEISHLKASIESDPIE